MILVKLAAVTMVKLPAVAMTERAPIPRRSPRNSDRRRTDVRGSRLKRSMELLPGAMYMEEVRRRRRPQLLLRRVVAIVAARVEPQDDPSAAFFDELPDTAKARIVKAAKAMGKEVKIDDLPWMKED